MCERGVNVFKEQKVFNTLKTFTLFPRQKKRKKQITSTTHTTHTLNTQTHKTRMIIGRKYSCGYVKSQTDRQTDTTPRKAGRPGHISIATTKKVPFASGDQLLTGRDGTLLCSAGPEWYGYLGIIDTEASTWAPAVGRPSKSAGCLAAQKKKEKKKTLLSSVQKNVNLAAN